MSEEPRPAAVAGGDGRPLRGAPPPPPAALQPRPAERLRAVLEIVTVALGTALLAEMVFVALGFRGDLQQLGSSGLAGLVLLQNAAALGLVALFLGLEGRGFGSLGFRRGRPLLEALLGLLLFPGILLLASYFRLGLLRLLPGLATVEENPLLGLIRGPSDVALFLVLSILGGGLGEETVRAFVLRRFESHLGGMAVGLAVWSTLFGAMHWIQGIDTAVTVAFIGLMLGLIYAWRRNPIAAIVAHAAFDVTQTLLAYSLLAA